jgi:hypothetical protein
MGTLVNYDPKPIKAGADWSIKFVVEDANNQPVNLTGWTGTCQFRERPGSELLASPTVTVTGVTGEIQISLAATVTSTLPTITMMADAFITDGSTTECLWEGTVKVSPRITR